MLLIFLLSVSSRCHSFFRGIHLQSNLFLLFHSPGSLFQLNRPRGAGTLTSLALSKRAPTQRPLCRTFPLPERLFPQKPSAYSPPTAPRYCCSPHLLSFISFVHNTYYLLHSLKVLGMAETFFFLSL